MATEELKKISLEAIVLTTGTGFDKTNLRDLKTVRETFDRANASVGISAITYSLSAPATIKRGGNIILELAAGEAEFNLAASTGSIYQNESDDIEIELTNPDDYIILRLSKATGYPIFEEGDDHLNPDWTETVIVDDSYISFSRSYHIDEEFDVGESISIKRNSIPVWDIDAFQEEIRDEVDVRDFGNIDIQIFKSITDNIQVSEDIELDYPNRFNVELDDSFNTSDEINNNLIKLGNIIEYQIEDLIQKGTGSDNYFAEDYVDYNEMYVNNDLFEDLITFPVENELELDNQFDVDDSFESARIRQLELEDQTESEDIIDEVSPVRSNVINKLFEESFDSEDTFDRTVEYNRDRDESIIIIDDEPEIFLTAVYLNLEDDVLISEVLEGFDITIESDSTLSIEDEFIRTVLFERDILEDIEHNQEPYFAEDYVQAGQFYTDDDVWTDEITLPKTYVRQFSEEQRALDSNPIMDFTRGFFDDVDVKDDPTDDILDSANLVISLRLNDDVYPEDEFERIANLSTHIESVLGDESIEDWIIFPVVVDQVIEDVDVSVEDDGYLNKVMTAEIGDDVITDDEASIGLRLVLELFDVAEKPGGDMFEEEYSEPGEKYVVDGSTDDEIDLTLV